MQGDGTRPLIDLSLENLAEDVEELSSCLSAICESSVCISPFWIHKSQESLDRIGFRLIGGEIARLDVSSECRDFVSGIWETTDALNRWFANRPDLSDLEAIGWLNEVVRILRCDERQLKAYASEQQEIQRPLSPLTLPEAPGNLINDYARSFLLHSCQLLISLQSGELTDVLRSGALAHIEALGAAAHSLSWPAPLELKWDEDGWTTFSLRFPSGNESQCSHSSSQHPEEILPECRTEICLALRQWCEELPTSTHASETNHGTTGLADGPEDSSGASSDLTKLPFPRETLVIEGNDRAQKFLQLTRIVITAMKHAHPDNPAAVNFAECVSALGDSAKELKWCKPVELVEEEDGRFQLLIHFPEELSSQGYFSACEDPNEMFTENARAIATALVMWCEMLPGQSNLRSQWIGPKSPAEWQKIFNLGWKTIKRRIDCGDIRAQEVNSKSWKIAADDIPRQQGN